MDASAGEFDAHDLESIHAPGAIQSCGALLVAPEDGLVVSHASANLSDFLGISAQDAVGRPLASLIDPAALSRLLARDMVNLRPRHDWLPRLTAGAHRRDGGFYVELEPRRGRGDRAARLRAPRIIHALRGAADKPALFALAIAELRRITGFDRVHVYRFDPQGHGEVIAEACAPELHPLLGLRFPAIYIPRVARDILAGLTIRIIADVEAAPVPLVSAVSAAPSPDLSLCLLRMPARCCTGFFRNMGLQASVSIALMVDGRLWGVLSCHHRSPAHLSPSARGLCEVIGNVTAMRVAELRAARGVATRARWRRFLATLAPPSAVPRDDRAALADALAADGPGLLAVCDAAGAIIRLGGRTVGVGRVPGGLWDDALLDALLARAPADGAPAAWVSLADVLRDGALPLGADTAGALVLPLQHAAGDAIAWLRPEQAVTVRWGSAPQPAAASGAMPRIGAAASQQTFSVWQEEVRGRSLPWQPEDLDAALEMRRELDRLMAGYVGSMRIARAAAERAMQAKSQFLATMSHEIRSPMSSLLGVLELLRGTALSDEQRRMADMIHGSGSMLLAVLNDILDFSKIEAGALSVAPASVSLRSLVADLVEPMAVTAAARGLALQATVDPAIPDAISTDPLRLRQILGNLLSNAIKFTRSGSITLHVDIAAAALRFRLRDTGIGMSAEVIARLFTPFMQADGSTTRHYGGTGLGLCISQQLVRLLGGELYVTSEEGVGSEFTVQIPLVPCVADAIAVRTPDIPVAAELPKGKRVLVVDDDATIRWLLQRQLQTLGYDTDVAEDGEAGLQRLRGGGYDLLLTDCHMPRLDGAALTEAVRAAPDAAMRALPVVGLTADVTDAQRTRCLAAGMTELAIKPLTIERLSQLLVQCLPVAAAPIASAAPALRPVAFDDQIFLSVFPPGDPDGAAWLSEWVAAARQDVRDLGALLARLGEGETSRADLRALAHRLAGTSFSTGAMLLGQAARTLEHACDAADPAELQTLYSAVAVELNAGASAVAAFLAAPCP